MEVYLTADAQQNIAADFNDFRNKNWQKISKEIDRLINLSQSYQYIFSNYPFQDGDFVSTIKKRLQQIQKDTDRIIGQAADDDKALLALKYAIAKLNNQETPDQIIHQDIEAYYPIQQFDSIIWRSPYYKSWIDAWLQYASRDRQHAIDLLFAYGQIIPDKAVSEVGSYIWDRMNAGGHYDMMLHLDTTWLAGCASTRSVGVRKRIEGYKRMATGNKAPNIVWNDENGQQMDLYSIQADTVMIVFWSDDCHYCKQKLPALYNEYASRDNVEVIAVAVDNDDSSLDTGKAYMPDWHHVWAKDGWNDNLLELYNVFGTPALHLLNDKHEILMRP